MVTLSNSEWREYIDESTQLVFDLDTPVFMAASAQEVEVMTVTHKESGEEWFLAKDVPEFERVCVNPEVREVGYNGEEKPRYLQQPTGKLINTKFKNKTEFWGRTKVKVTGWLGDVNEKQEIKGLPAYVREDFELTFDKVVTTNVGAAINALKRKVQEVVDYLGVDKCIHIIGGGLTHRHDLKLPININKPDSPEEGRYKGARGSKPLLLNDVREYAVRTMGAVDTTDTGVETDDVFNFYMNKSHSHFKKTGKHLYIGISIDKDSLSFNGLILNPYRDVKTKEFAHPVPYLIDGLGKLDLRKGKMKGKGLLWFMGQLLLGDAADCYYPTRHSGIKFGDAAAYELLYDCKTPKAAIQRTYDKYKEWYGESGTQFTAWDGTEVNYTALEWLEVIFECAYMLKTRSDKTTFKTLMDYTGVKHNES